MDDAEKTEQLNNLLYELDFEDFAKQALLRFAFESMTQGGKLEMELEFNYDGQEFKLICNSKVLNKHKK